MKKKINFDDEDLTGYSSNQLKRIADYRLRQYLMASWDGKCFITLKSMSPANVQVAHFKDRKHLTTRYNLKNCHLVSTKSNVWDAKVYDEDLYGRLSKHHFEYELALLDCYGEGVFEELEILSSTRMMGDRHYFLDQINKLKC